jgi:hypothetical protein
MLMMMIMSSIIVMFFNGGSIPYIGIVFVVVFYFLARIFYNYLRNDDTYKNTRQYSSDRPGESYLVKGESDSKKVFLIVWVIVILILAAASLWLYSFNKGLI